MGKSGSRRWRWAAAALAAIVVGITIWAAARREAMPAELWFVVPTAAKSKVQGEDCWMLSGPGAIALVPGGDEMSWTPNYQIADDATITSIDLYPPAPLSHDIRLLLTGEGGRVLEPLLGSYVPTTTTAQAGGHTWTKCTLRPSK